MALPQVVEAVYEKGVLRPLEKLDLREGEHVRIRIERSVVEETFGILRDRRELVEKVLRELDDEVNIH